MQREETAYETLGVPPDAPMVDLIAAYRSKAMQCHPDKVGQTEDANERMAFLNSQYDKVKTVEARLRYDDELYGPVGGGGAPAETDPRPQGSEGYYSEEDNIGPDLKPSHGSRAPRGNPGFPTNTSFWGVSGGFSGSGTGGHFASGPGPSGGIFGEYGPQPTPFGSRPGPSTGFFGGFGPQPGQSAGYRPGESGSSRPGPWGGLFGERVGPQPTQPHEYPPGHHPDWFCSRPGPSTGFPGEFGPQPKGKQPAGSNPGIFDSSSFEPWGSRIEDFEKAEAYGLGSWEPPFFVSTIFFAPSMDPDEAPPGSSKRPNPDAGGPPPPPSPGSGYGSDSGSGSDYDPDAGGPPFPPNSGSGSYPASGGSSSGPDPARRTPRPSSRLWFWAYHCAVILRWLLLGSILCTALAAAGYLLVQELPRQAVFSALDVDWRSHYEVLNVSYYASPREVRKAYHARVVQLHPDKATGGGSGAAGSELQRVMDAYAVLSDSISRCIYDNSWVGGNGTRLAGCVKAKADVARVQARQDWEDFVEDRKASRWEKEWRRRAEEGRRRSGDGAEADGMVHLMQDIVYPLAVVIGRLRRGLLRWSGQFHVFLKTLVIRYRLLVRLM